MTFAAVFKLYLRASVLEHFYRGFQQSKFIYRNNKRHFLFRDLENVFIRCWCSSNIWFTCKTPCRFYQRNATFTLFWIYIGFTSFKGSYKRLFRRTVIDQEPKYLYYRGPMGKQVTFDTSGIYVNTFSQWRSSNLFSLAIQGDTRTFELTD